jgi:fumarate reductase iron-sulfur subunit
MYSDSSRVDLLTRREIEALVAVPLIKAFMNDIGKEKALLTAEAVIMTLARESGRQMAEKLGGNGLLDFEKGLTVFSQGDAMVFDLLESTDKRLSFNTTRCRYAEMYRANGMEDFGYLLSCRRDFALMEGFNPAIKLVRTQTIMQGADYCDFRFSPA